MSYDIGDDVTLATRLSVDGVDVDAALVTVTVTSPAGATSTPTVTHPATGQYRAVVSATAAGRWLYTWDTSNPTGVDHGHFDVAPDPSDIGDRPLPLATIDDIEAISGPLTDTQRARAPGLLRSASGKVRVFCTGVAFDRVDDDVIIVPIVGPRITLPVRPVRSVSQVVAIGDADVGDFVLTGWRFDGLETIEVAGLNSSTFVSLPAVFDDLDSISGRNHPTARVTLSHGFDRTPEFVSVIVAEMVDAVLRSPTAASNVVAETIGQYSYQVQQGVGSRGSSPYLTADHRDQLRAAGFRRESATARTAAG